jgi:hypothetical protein
VKINKQSKIKKNMHRNQVVKALRSEIVYEAIQSNPIQLFQDTTLRPILKFQHELILAVYHEYLITHKINFEHLTSTQKNTKIEQSLKQNQTLQSILKGLILALFDETEIAFWMDNKDEINKRIQQLMIKRIQSAFEQKIK